MTDFIKLQDTLLVRSIALRNGQGIENCYIPEDELDGCFHIGAKIGDEVVGVGSFYPVSHADLGKNGFQLRLMGVLPTHHQKGIGKKILTHGIDLLRNRNIAYLWCNARLSAYVFYEKMGFQYCSPPFEIPNIGTHRAMVLHLGE